MLLLSLSAASALLFVRIVGEIWHISPRLDTLMKALMLALAVCGVVNALLLNDLAFSFYNALVAASVAVTAAAVVAPTWHADPGLRWLGLGFLLVTLAAAFPVKRNYGLIEFSFLTQYALMTALAGQAPILFYGLYQRLTRRLLPTARAKAMQVIDPLTGLHSFQVLTSRLRQVMAASEHHQQPFAILTISLVNQASLQAAHNREIGERAMVMAASRIRSVARPSDMVARVGDAQFVLLINSPVSADAANDYAIRLLASGLRSSEELPSGDGLQFHIAVGHIKPKGTPLAHDADTFLARMLTALHGMNDGSRKAIRRARLKRGGFVALSGVFYAI